MIPWFSKTEGNTYATIAASPFPLQEKPTQAQYVARRISGTVAGEFAQKSTIPSTHHNPYLSHYIICLSFSSPPLHPCRFISPLFPNLLLSFPFAFFSFAFLFARVLDCLFVAMAQDDTKLCDFTNTNNNDFLSTPIAPLNDVESCEMRTSRNFKLGDA